MQVDRSPRSVVVTSVTCHTARDRNPATERIGIFKIVNIRDGFVSTVGSKGFGCRRCADAGRSTNGCHIELVLSICFQTCKGIGLGVDVVKGCVVIVRGFLVAEVPTGFAATGGPIQACRVLGDVRHSQLVRCFATGTYRHLHIIYIPTVNSPYRNMSTGRRTGKILSNVIVGTIGGKPIVAVVGVDKHKGGGIRRVGHIAHFNNRIAVTGSCPEGEL